MIVPKNSYRLQDRNLNFEVADDFDFNNSSTCYYLRGGNGFGKTSFLEKIVIPALKVANRQYLYIGQDIRTQLYTLRALLSMQGHKISDTDEYELLKIWVHQGQTARTFILDEFDKYFPDYHFIFDWSRSFIQNYIIVTHQHLQPARTGAEGLEATHVIFELIGFDGQFKHVRVRKESYDNVKV